MATEEDEVWEDGKCSGTMYCGDRDHYAFLKEAFGLFAHQNALQRDMCPSATRFEGEIIAMALDLMHGEAAEGADPAGMVTSGGTAASPRPCSPTGRRGASQRGIAHPNLVKPETGPSGLRQGLSPVRDRAAPGAGRSRDDAGSRGGRRGADRREHGRDHRLGRQLRLRHDRPDRRAGGELALEQERRPARRRLPRRLPAAVRRGARLPDPALRLPCPRRDQHLG